MVATAEPLNAPKSAVNTMGRVRQMLIIMSLVPKCMPGLRRQLRGFWVCCLNA